MQHNQLVSPESALFELFSGFIDGVSCVFSEKEQVWSKWEHFHRLISSRPIDYNQVYAFISKVAEAESQSNAPHPELLQQDNKQLLAEEEQLQQRLYKLLDFGEFLQQSQQPISRLQQNSFYNSCHVVQVESTSANRLLVLVAMAHLKTLFQETFSEEASSRFQLYQLYARLNARKIRLVSNLHSTYTVESLASQLLKSLGALITLRLSNCSVTRVLQALMCLMSSDALFLEASVCLIKSLLVEFVETCATEVLTTFSSSTGSVLTPGGSAQLAEKELRSKLVYQIRQNWSGEIKPDLLYMLTIVVARPIEVHTLSQGKMEKTLFQSKTRSANASKINLLQHEREFYLLVYITETDAFDWRQSEQQNLIASLEREDESTSLTLAKLMLAPMSPRQQQLLLPSSSASNQAVQQYLQIPPANTGAVSPLNEQQKVATALHSSINNNNVAVPAPVPQVDSSLVEREMTNFRAASSEKLRLNSLESRNLLTGVAGTAIASTAANTTSSSSSPFNALYAHTSATNRPASSSASQAALLSKPRPAYVPVTTAIGNPALLGAHRVHNKHSHFDTTTSPKYALAPTLQKSSTNSYGSRALGNEEQWNRGMLLARTKELLFTINIDSDKLNQMAKLGSSGTPAAAQKENQARSPHKTLFYPEKRTTLLTNLQMTPT